MPNNDDTDDSIAAYYAVKKNTSQVKRAANRERSAQHLENLGVTFSEHNNGAHLIIYGRLETIDFWPGTGLWRCRGGKQVSGRGIEALLTRLEVVP